MNSLACCLARYMVNELAGMNVKVCARDLSGPVIKFSRNEMAYANPAVVFEAASARTS